MSENERATLFALLRPELFHVAEEGAWPSIERLGLLSTSAVLDVCRVDHLARLEYEGARRTETKWLTDPEHGRFAIRDQKPLKENALARSLTGGLTTADWRALLNGRVFLWAQPKRLLSMLRTYKHQANLVLVFDTAILMEAYAERVEVSCINTGAPYPPKPSPRGLESFRQLAHLTPSELRKVAEVTIPYALPDAARFIRRGFIQPATS